VDEATVAGTAVALPNVVRKYFDLFKQTAKEFNEDKVPRLGAALAYYTIFSVGPLLLIAVAIAGIFFGDEAAQGRISATLGRVFGSNIAESLEDTVQAAAKPQSGTVATVVGIVTLLFGAAGVFGQLKDALNTIWNVETKRTSGIFGFIKDRFLSMAMVLGMGFLLLVTLLVDAAISAMGDVIAGSVGGEAVMQAIQLVISFAVVTVVLAAIFRILPDLKIAWRDVWLGAVFTSILFVIGKFAIGLYLGKAAVGSAYGAAGGLVILLVWVYWSAQIVLFGAEFTQVYARTLGSLRGDESKEKAVAEASRPEYRRLPAGPGGRGRQDAGGTRAAPVIAGLLAGAILGLVSGSIAAVVMVLKSVRKLFLAR
jgi:membrane protein